MKEKITVVGAGNVGATTAQRLAELDLADILLIDIPATEGMPAGKALDITQSGPIYGYDSRVSGATKYEAARGSDVVIITAGVPRKPGMSRDDLLSINAGIVKAVAAEIAVHCSNAILIVVSNPLDAMCQVALKVSGFPKERVIGMAGVLDSARFASFIAEALQVSVLDVQPTVLGGHGDTMVPIPRYSTVAGVPLSELMSADTLQALIRRTRDGGAEIVKLLKTGSAYYAPSASVVAMVESILKDKKRIMPCAAYLEGEYGCHGHFLGVPVKLGRKGIEKIMSLTLTPEEQAQLAQSAASVKDLVESMRKMKLPV